MKAPLPIHEPERLEALRRYQILDTAPERDFDDLTLLALQICGTPIALISLVDEHRQWFKSKIGESENETAREIGFCTYGILQAEVFQVEDALTDERFAASPLVTGQRKIRFYAGAPLVTPDGYVVGMLCVLDRVPRQLSAGQKEALQALSRQVVAQLELHGNVRELKKTVNELKSSQDELQWKTTFLEAQVNSSIDGILVVDKEGKKILQNQRMTNLMKIPRHIADNPDDEVQLRWVTGAVRDSGRFIEKVTYLNSHRDEISHDEIELKDGPVLDRYSAPVLDRDGNYYGRIWTFRDITARKLEEADLVRTHQELVRASHQAGMAEVAAGVLHNIGNVLNSVNVASTCVAESVKKSKSANLIKVAALLRDHAADLGTYLTHDPKGKQIPGYLEQLAEHLGKEQATALKEIVQLQKNVEHIKDIVTLHQSYASVSGVSESVHVTDLIEDTLRMTAESITKHGIEVVCEFGNVPPALAKKSLVLQILVNLVRNATQAFDNSGRTDKRLTLRVFNGGGRVKVSVADNAIGILPENLSRIFTHGFTTKKEGHGFGLHSGAQAAREMGGALLVHSDGPGTGATFTLELPCGKN